MTTPVTLTRAARLLAVGALALAACGRNPTATPTIAPRPSTALPPTRPAALPNTATPAASQAVEATVPGSRALDLSAIDWDDRALFEQALRPAEAPVLDLLRGASVYHLTLTLAADLTTLTGHEAVRYTNQEAAALDRLAFHLHPNLLGGAMTISALTVDGEAAEAEYAPERTSLSVPLASPLAPGAQVVVEMDFEVVVPTDMTRNYGVLAAVDGRLALAHFYPMLAVFDADGWNTAPPPPWSDVTYSDVSFYLLQLTAPAGLVVAGGGTRLEAVAGPDDTQILTFAAGPARDMFLAASADYAVLTTEAAGVTLTSYALPAQQPSARTALQVAAAALHDYEARYGPYPYRELDLVAIPTLALGVEYPGLIALNQKLFDPDANFGPTPVSVLLEATVAHEVAHQWFYGLVGDDQLDQPWLDESLTQYATWRYYLDEQGPPGAAGFAGSLAGRWAQVDDAPIPIGLPAAAYVGQEYSAIIYGRGPLFIDALGDTLGQQTLTDFLRDYAATYRWQIATTADFQKLAEAHCACDLTELFDAWVYGPHPPPL